MHECSVHSDTILYPLWVPIFTVIIKAWHRANRAMVTNNSTVIIEVMLIKVMLILHMRQQYISEPWVV